MSIDVEYPWMILGILLVIGVVIWDLMRKPGTFSFSRVSDAEALPIGMRTLLRHVPWLLRALALASIVVAASRPQLEEDFSEAEVEGIDIFLVLDMSGSMMAVDMTQQEIQNHQLRFREEPNNRFDNAVATLQNFVDQREHDRIGMVVFAREAYLQFPLTLDYSTIQGLLERLELNAIDPSSTAIGNALGLGVRGLLDSDAESRAIILITDGKQQGGNISPVHAAETAADEGIQIFPILVGRDGPTMVPVGPRRRGFGQRYEPQDYPVDPDLLAQLAEMTDGAFHRAEDRQQLENDLNEILDQLETTQMQDVASVRETDLFGLFSGLAVVYLALEALLAFVVIRRYP